MGGGELFTHQLEIAEFHCTQSIMACEDSKNTVFIHTGFFKKNLIIKF